jgi:MYXO-CTERM domain-containing protein
MRRLPSLSAASSFVILILFGGCGALEAQEDVATHRSALSLAVPATDDTFINSSSPDNNNGKSTSIYTGRNGMDGMMRGLLRFTMPALQGRAMVTSAELRMTTRGTGTGEAQPPTAATLQLEAIGAPWVSGNGIGNSQMSFTVGQPCGGGVVGATWNDADCAAPTPWTTPGGSVAGSVRATADVPATIGAVVSWASTAAMVSDVQSWIDDPASNHGWLVRSSTESTMGAQRFSSGEATTNIPELRISFSCKPGFVEDPTSFCAGAGGAGSAGTGGATGGSTGSSGSTGNTGSKGGSGCAVSAAATNDRWIIGASLLLGALVWRRRRSR